MPCKQTKEGWGLICRLFLIEKTFKDYMREIDAIENSRGQSDKTSLVLGVPFKINP